MTKKTKTKLISSLILITLPLIILILAFSLSVKKVEAAYCLGSHPDCAHSGTLGYLSAGKWKVTISGLYGQYCPGPEQTQEKVKINYPEGRAWLSDPGGCCVQRGSGGLGCRLTSSTTFTTSGGNVSWVANWDSVHDYTFSKTKISGPAPPPACTPILSINKSVDKTEALPGDILTYTLDYKNKGNCKVTGVTISDDYDDNYLDISDNGGGTVSGGIISWNIGNLNPNASRTKKFTAKIKTTLPSGTIYIYNSAVIDSNQTSPVESNKVQTIVTTDPALTISKLGRNVTDGQTEWVEEVWAWPEDTVEFSIAITSTGVAAATNIQVKDILPSRLTFVSGDYIIEDWHNIGDLSPGVSKTFKFEAEVADADQFSTGLTTLTNTVYTRADDVAEISDIASVSVEKVSEPALTISKLGRNVSDYQTSWVESVSAEPEEIIEFSIDVTSVGETTAENVWVEDILPSQMSYQGNLRIDGIYSSGDIISGLNIGDLSSNQSKTITFEARVASEANFSYGTTSLVNTARAWAEGVSEVVDTATVNVYRGYAPPSYINLTISKKVRNLTTGTPWQESIDADPSDRISFKIQINSTGSGTAYNVWVRDTLPSKIIYWGNLRIDGSYSDEDITGGLDLGSLSPDQSKTITFEAKVASEDNFTYYGTTSLINRARVRADNFGEISDTATVNVTTFIRPSLTVTKKVKNLSQDQTSWRESVEADPSDKIAFYIKVKATGGIARDVIVKDTLPSKIDYEGNLKVNNNYFSGDITEGINIGDLSSGQSKTITFEGEVAPASRFAFGTTNLINTATAYNVDDSDTDTAKIIVKRRAIAGAVTVVPTGIVGNRFLDYLVIPLIITLGIIWAFKKYFVYIDEWLEKKKAKLSEFQSKRALKKAIRQVKSQKNSFKY